MKRITLALIAIAIFAIYTFTWIVAIDVVRLTDRVDSLTQENVLLRSNNIALLQNKIKDNNKPKEVEVQACPSEDIQVLIQTPYGPAVIQIPEGFFDGEENKITPEEENNDLAPTPGEAYKEYLDKEKRRMAI